MWLWASVAIAVAALGAPGAARAADPGGDLCEVRTESTSGRSAVAGAPAAPGTGGASERRVIRYDAAGRVVAVETTRIQDMVTVETTTTEGAYDRAGRLIRVDHRSESPPWDSPDGRGGRIGERTRSWTTYTYDRAGRLRTQHDGWRSWRHDGVAWVEEEHVVPGGTDTTWSYDRAGRLSTITYGRGRAASVVRLVFDENGVLQERRLPIVKPPGAGEWRTLYHYDAAGRLSRFELARCDASPSPSCRVSSTLTFVYDAEGRLVREEDDRRVSRLTWTHGAYGVELFSSVAAYSGGKYVIASSYSATGFLESEHSRTADNDESSLRYAYGLGCLRPPTSGLPHLGTASAGFPWQDGGAVCVRSPTGAFTACEVHI